MQTAIAFRNTLRTALQGAGLQHMPFIDVNAGQLHRLVGNYPGGNHRMPVCCKVMRDAMLEQDVILQEPKA